MRHRLYRVSVVVLAMLVLAGCGTIQGLGRDMQTVGAWMEEQGPP